jgi:hypothetical protein
VQQVLPRRRGLLGYPLSRARRTLHRRGGEERPGRLAGLPGDPSISTGTGDWMERFVGPLFSFRGAAVAVRLFRDTTSRLTATVFRNLGRLSLSCRCFCNQNMGRSTTDPKTLSSSAWCHFNLARVFPFSLNYILIFLVFFFFASLRHPSHIILRLTQQDNTQPHSCRFKTTSVGTERRKQGMLARAGYSMEDTGRLS